MGPGFLTNLGNHKIEEGQRKCENMVLNHLIKRHGDIYTISNNKWAWPPTTNVFPISNVKNIKIQQRLCVMFLTWGVAFFWGYSKKKWNFV